MDTRITLIVNGQKRTVVTDPERSLLDVLREDLQVMGPKYGCGEGRCGACTVLITTIEGLAEDDRLHPVQQAFLDEGAIQCGYCTPGMILSAVALLQENPRPTDDEITEGMNGNICRCNGYAKILNAVRRAASQIKEVKRS